MSEWKQQLAAINTELLRLGETAPVFEVSGRIFSFAKKAFRHGKIAVTERAIWAICGKETFVYDRSTVKIIRGPISMYYNIFLFF